MAGLKSYLYGAAPLLGLTPAALYERQRALVALGALKATAGRGPGSGVPLTAENAAAILISVLAADNLADVDDRVLHLMQARPGLETGVGKHGPSHKRWLELGKPVFRSEVAEILRGNLPRWSAARKSVHTIRVSRCWCAQLVSSPSGAMPIVYLTDLTTVLGPRPPISITAEIEGDRLSELVVFTRGALSQIEEDIP